MFNGVGLTTPRGSGTNGFVQRNRAALPQTRIDFQKGKSFKNAHDMNVKKANVELLLHAHKRKAELDIMKLEDELRAAGMPGDEIERAIARERKNMMEAVHEGSLRFDSVHENRGTHALALAKQQEKFEKALSIDKVAHVHGQAFDQDLQQQLKLERMRARAEQEQRRSLAEHKAKACAKREKSKPKAVAGARKVKEKGKGDAAEGRGSKRKASARSPSNRWRNQDRAK